MIKFLFKMLLRDRSISLFPMIVVIIGVSITVFFAGYIDGVVEGMISQNANFSTGHVKIMTKPYADNKDQQPNDLALLDVYNITEKVKKDFLQYEWANRITFGGLIDVSDKEGNSIVQGIASGLAIDIFENKVGELERMNIDKALVSGKLPQHSNEVLLGKEFAEKLKLNIGDEITFMGVTMNGSMAFGNLKVSGTINYGVSEANQSILIMDITDARKILDMEDASTGILGFAKNKIYSTKEAMAITEKFNNEYKNDDDEYKPVMYILEKQGETLASYLNSTKNMAGVLTFLLILIMSVVLWNVGLLGGLRRYQEFGIRLALGESKGHIYFMIILEGFLIGCVGSIIGTGIGLGMNYYMQVHGVDISGMISGGESMLMPSILYSKFTLDLLYIGFIPGIFAVILGNLLSGISVFKRETAMLFKELEN